MPAGDSQHVTQMEGFRPERQGPVPQTVWSMTVSPPPDPDEESEPKSEPEPAQIAPVWMEQSTPVDEPAEQEN
jgi:hypothetical protein